MFFVIILQVYSTFLFKSKTKIQKRYMSVLTCYHACYQRGLSVNSSGLKLTASTHVPPIHSQLKDRVHL